MLLVAPLHFPSPDVRAPINGASNRRGRGHVPSQRVCVNSQHPCTMYVGKYSAAVTHTM